MHSPRLAHWRLAFLLPLILVIGAGKPHRQRAPRSFNTVRACTLSCSWSSSNYSEFIDYALATYHLNCSSPGSTMCSWVQAKWLRVWSQSASDYVTIYLECEPEWAECGWDGVMNLNQNMATYGPGHYNYQTGIWGGTCANPTGPLAWHSIWFEKQ